MQDYRKLKVWEKAHKFTLEIYKVTEDFPKEESYALTSQIRRAAVSIPSNLAEGCGKNSDSEFAHYLNISLGSANEAEYYLLLAKDLNYMLETDYQIVCAYK